MGTLEFLRTNPIRQSIPNLKSIQRIQIYFWLLLIICAKIAAIIAGAPLELYPVNKD
jgi:hypothetical protein